MARTTMVAEMDSRGRISLARLGLKGGAWQAQLESDGSVRLQRMAVENDIDYDAIYAAMATQRPDLTVTPDYSKGVPRR